MLRRLPFSMRAGAAMVMPRTTVASLRRTGVSMRMMRERNW